MRIRHLVALLFAAFVLAAPSSAPAFPLNGPIARALLRKSTTPVSPPPTVTCSTAGNAYIAAMTTVPDQAHKDAYCTLINTLEAAGIWAKLDKLYLLASHSVQSTQINAVRPTDAICTEAGTGALTYTTDRGVQTDGSRYLTCGPLLTSGAHFSQNSAVAGVFTDATIVGQRHGTSGGNIQNRVATTTSVQGHLNGTATNTVTLTVSATGWRHISVDRTDSTAFTTYVYSGYTGLRTPFTTSDTSTSIGTPTYYIFRHSSTVAAAGAKDMVVYTGGALDPTAAGELDQLHAALVTYLQTVGAI